MEVTLPGIKHWSAKAAVAAGAATMLLLTTSIQPAAAYTYSPFGPNLIRTPPKGKKEGYRYPRAIQLHYQSGSNASANGSMLGTLQWLADTGQIPSISIFRSNDEGRSWGNPITRVQDTIHGSAYQLMSQPHLYELPTAVGSMPAGTILLAALSRKQDATGNTYIMLYKSNNVGTSWSLVSTVAQGGPASEGSTPVWEPFLYATNGKLIVYYSDERDAAHSQKLVHQTTTNGTTWSSVVNDVVDPNPAGRPGMLTMARMNNGKYIITYEHCGSPGCRVEYRVSSNPESWESAAEQVVRLTSGTTPISTPYVVNLPNVGTNGAVVVSGRYGTSSFLVNYNYGAAGSSWVEVPAKLNPGWSRSMVPMDDGRSIFINSTPIQSDGYSRWYTANQQFNNPA